MKNIILLLVLVFVFLSCQDDEQGFDVMVSDVEIEFNEIAGGAVMRYHIPNNSEIFSIQAEYQNDFGEKVLKQGSYLNDSIILDGFTASRSEVPVHLSLRNERNEVSSAIQMSFNTHASASYAFFEQAEIRPYWDGFMLIYETPRYVDGYANVFYMGTNPMTQKLDTLLLKTFQIEGGRDTLYFPLEQVRDKNTVIVKTEDFKGHLVRQNIWNEVPAYYAEKMEPKNFKIDDPESIVFTDAASAVGWQYLFDGDTKGTQRYRSYRVEDKEFTFVMGPRAIGKHIILDLGENKIVAKMRFYGLLATNNWFNGFIWDNCCANKLPNEVTIMGSNHPENENSWQKVGYYKEPVALSETSWAFRVNDWASRATSYEELVAAAPCFMEVPFVVSEEPYRYYKIVVNSVFTAEYGINSPEYVTFHELEVYSKKD
ncbi:DUF4959 domain-containing protein [Butyricimonas virosa]|uniref:DUF4959 domain-containing protein n=1 Tax=Butyricimonas virosa TaxID=544645 RepID=UPI0015F30CDA|nr:DUF4959 domain-containing protein [Butyricimonas virosa]